MPRKRQPKPTTTERRLRLERQLSLVHWLSKEFGFDDNDGMLKACRDSEGRQDGVSRVYHVLQSRPQRKISPGKLARYESNVAKHLDKINHGRGEPITLKYFQQLAALGVEHYLSCLCESRNKFLAQLNEFVRSANGHRLPVEHFAEYAADDLKKIAFWMATGSGKTLLLHLNYLQFLHYFPNEADNILLVTPNEKLSEQHLQEFALSGIAARRVEESADILSSGNPVQVVEITKLVEKKRGKGASIPLERFDGKNLLFVDEGHKGSGGRAWFKSRDQLGENGFTFEYSATFGQALFAAGGEELTRQYGKSILVDYSYKHFYDDGFGKDFSVSNLTGTVEEQRTDLLMTGNLLSFYQQVCYFEERRDRLRAYHLEKPLLLLLGSTVTTTQSDVVKLVGFLQRFITNDKGETVKNLKTILSGKSGFVDDVENDLFHGKFEYVGKRSADKIYRDILRRVFHAETGGALYLRPLKRGKDEIGLKVGENNAYFALVFVGNAKKLCELIAKKYPVHEAVDAISDSLFAGVNSPASTVNLLIGAKKFMEGWNSWRVAGMGLLNVGKSEGAEIIQLFGRGVRLRGRNLTLKRSAALEEMEHPEHLHLLETLNIFAVRADFIASFRLYLEREGVDKHEIPLSIAINKEFLNKELLIPKATGEFADAVALVPDKNIRVTVDFSERVQTMQSAGGKVAAAQKSGDRETQLDREQLDRLDWEDLYFRLLEHKRLRGWDNFVVHRDSLRGILERCVTVNAADEYLKPQTFENLRQLSDAAVAGLQKYADRLHHTRRMRWQTKHMDIEKLDQRHGNFKRYTVQIPRDQKGLIEKVEQAVKKADWKLDRREDLPNVYFDRHLFQPLLCGGGEDVTVIPAGLVDSEKKFVAGLRDYCENHREEIKELEIFLLRNLPHRGIGFPDEGGDNFYPDFILWVKRGERQRVVFVEPHGLLHDPHPNRNSKVKLHAWLAEISAELSHRYPQQVEFDSFLVSDTKVEDAEGRWDANKKAMAENHILFAKEGEEVARTLIKGPKPR